MTKQKLTTDVFAIACLTVALGLAGCQQNDNGKTGRKTETGTTQGTTTPSQTTAGQTTTGQARTATGETAGKTGDYIDDSTITMRVKSALADELLLKDADISVTTNGGIVQLSGSVPTEQGLNRAVEIAGNQKNVKSVQSSLTVKPSIAK